MDSLKDMRLVEAAAKASGYGIARWSDDGRGLLLAGVQEPWNPLEDDGDALRLAVALQMDVYVRAEWVEAVAPMGAPQKALYGLECPRRAARLAITRAAAAMPARRVFGAA